MLSVIVPVYNAERYLPSCLDSLLCYIGGDLEVVVVDDGSQDASGAICDRYAARDVRVKVFHQANAGVSAARNKGLQHATGDWIAFVDADDEVLPGYVEACLQRERTADVAYFAHEGYQLTAGYFEERQDIEQQLLGLKCNEQGFEFYGYTWNKFFRASIIREHRLRFPEYLNHREDEYFTTEYMHYATSLEILPEQLYRYRIDNNGNHLTHKELSVLTLRTLASCIAQQIAYWQEPALVRYEVYRALFMYCDALLRASWTEAWLCASQITCFVDEHIGDIDPQQYPFGFVSSASSTPKLLFWLIKRKIRK